MTQATPAGWGFDAYRAFTVGGRTVTACCMRWQNRAKESSDSAAIRGPVVRVVQSVAATGFVHSGGFRPQQPGVRLSFESHLLGVSESGDRSGKRLSGGLAQGAGVWYARTHTDDARERLRGLLSGPPTPASGNPADAHRQRADQLALESNAPSESSLTTPEIPVSLT